MGSETTSNYKRIDSTQRQQKKETDFQNKTFFSFY